MNMPHPQIVAPTIIALLIGCVPLVVWFYFFQRQLRVWQISILGLLTLPAALVVGISLGFAFVGYWPRLWVHWLEINQ